MTFPLVLNHSPWGFRLMGFRAALPGEGLWPAALETTLAISEAGPPTTSNCGLYHLPFRCHSVFLSITSGVLCKKCCFLNPTNESELQCLRVLSQLIILADQFPCYQRTHSSLIYHKLHRLSFEITEVH